MITRFTLPIDILHDERIVALVVDCGPESIAVLISLHVILRRRGSITRDKYLIAKIRHDLSFTLDEPTINAILDHLTASGYLQPEEASDDTGGRGRLAPSGEHSTALSPVSVDSPISPDSPVTIDTAPRKNGTPHSLRLTPATPPIKRNARSTQIRVYPSLLSQQAHPR